MKNYNKIDSYLKGKMSDSEKEEFKNKIEATPKLAEEVEWQRLEGEVIDLMAIEDSMQTKLDALKNKILTEEATNEKDKIKSINSGKRLNFYVRMSIAASLLVLIGVFFYGKKNYSNQSLLSYGYQLEEPDYSNTRQSGGSSNEPKFEERYIDILQLKKSSLAVEAIQYFSSFQNSSNPLYINAKLNLGHSYILNQNFQKAVETFEEINNSPGVNSRFQQMATFYKAIALIGIDEGEKAKNVLRNIEQTNGHRYKASAEKMLKKLDSLWRGF